MKKNTAACPPVSGMQQVQGEHFFLEGDKGTFTEAQAYCAASGLALAPVTTEEEFDRLILATSISEISLETCSCFTMAEVFIIVSRGSLDRPAQPTL